MSSKSKSKFACLLSLVKQESKDLYKLIISLCLDGSFRSQKYKNTMLMPSAKVVDKIKSMYDNDNEAGAIDAIRSLMLKDHLEPKQFTKDAVIGTLQYDRVLSDPSEIQKNIQPMNVLHTKQGGDVVVTIVYKYSGDIPATKEGKTAPAPLVGTGVRGGEAKDLKRIQDVTKSLIVPNNASSTIQNFFKAVAGAINVLQNKDNADYQRAKFFLAANPILSWFFLTMPGRSDGLIKFEDLENFEWQSVVDAEKVIKDCESSQYNLNKDAMKHIKSMRSKIVTDGDKSSLIKMINSSYENGVGVLASKGSCDDMLKGDASLKLLMDENRFMYESAISNWEEVDDALKALGAIEWNSPAKNLTICSQKVQDSLKCHEAFVSGPTMFVKSVYFMYVPLTPSIEEQLSEVMKGGAISGGNPNAVNSVVFTGGAARKALNKSGDVKLASLVKMLSKSQRDALKGML